MKKKIETKNRGKQLIIRVTNTLMTGSLAGKGIDGNGNPIHGFLLVDYVTPEIFDEQVADFKKKYPTTVLQNGAHKITTGFKEVINNGQKLKEVTQYVQQELYKDGKWSPMRPNKSGEHVEIINAEEPKKWTTPQKVLAWALGIIAVLVGAKLVIG